MLLSNAVEWDSLKGKNKYRPDPAIVTRNVWRTLLSYLNLTALLIYNEQTVDFGPFLLSHPNLVNPDIATVEEDQH